MGPAARDALLSAFGIEAIVEHKRLAAAAAEEERRESARASSSGRTADLVDDEAAELHVGFVASEF